MGVVVSLFLSSPSLYTSLYTSLSPSLSLSESSCNFFCENAVKAVDFNRTVNFSRS